MVDDWDDVDNGRPINQYVYEGPVSQPDDSFGKSWYMHATEDDNNKPNDRLYESHIDSGANSSFSSDSCASNHKEGSQKSRESSSGGGSVGCGGDGGGSLGLGRGIRGRGKPEENVKTPANIRQSPSSSSNVFQTPNQQPKEYYIPPEPSNDESEIFGQAITSGINFEQYDKIPIKVTGENCPAPISCFNESGLSSFLLNNVRKSGYNRPTPIQKNAIPIVLSQRDVMGCAQTGSGKTAAFLLPILHTLLLENRTMIVGKPHVVIVPPTRELAIQIYTEARKFSMGSYLKVCIAYGGASFKHQVANIHNGCHILVATPGRLHDLVNKNYISFENIQFVVLDEADRMLDLGFMSSIEKVMNHPSMVPMDNRCTLMFSATFPEEIQRLAGNFLSANYIFIAVGIIGGACSDVRQTIYEVGRYDKRMRLLELINEADPSGTIVFVETRRQADFLASFLSESMHPTTSIHGDRFQQQREEALRDFKSNNMKVLIATSVAARGLDIKNVTHVINFDLPKDIDEYVHRIGRTGRVGNRGRASSFFDPEQDKGIASELVKILRQADQQVPNFLLNCDVGNSGDATNGQNRYGGRDVRHQQQQPEIVLEEDWC